MADSKQKAQKGDVESSLANLSLDAPRATTKASAKKKTKEPVADSWEDEDLSSSSGEDQPDSEQTTPITTTSSSNRPSIPNTPPPTTSSPATSHQKQQQQQQQWHPSGPSGPAPSERRPEKTDAVARRMIAAGLGLKVPKQTEEQREYQRSIREQERKRREQEKADEQRRKEEAERAKAAVWDD